MKISRRSDYALRALCSMAMEANGRPLSVRLLAERNDIPRRFLEQILLELKASGFVTSTQGRDGGFVLARQPEQINMGQVVRHFDGLLAPIACVSKQAYQPCSQESCCRFRRVLLEIRNYTAKRMELATLAQLIATEPVSSQEVYDLALLDGGGI
jgi:Rrf2 family protein